MRKYIADKDNPLTDKFLASRNIPVKEGRDLLKTATAIMRKMYQDRNPK